MGVDQKRFVDAKVRRPKATIPVPVKDIPSLHATAMGTKELVEELSGQRGDSHNWAVTYGDLVRLGLIKEQDIPIR